MVSLFGSDANVAGVFCVCVCVCAGSNNIQVSTGVCLNVPFKQIYC